MALDKINIRSIYFIFLIFLPLIINIILPGIEQYLFLSLNALFYLIGLLFLSPLRINIYFAIAILISMFSLIVGLFNDWYLFDVVGDSFRFIAPIFAFTVGLKILDQLNKEQLAILIKIILIIYIILFFLAAFNIISIILFQSQNLFSYNTRLDANINHLLFIFLFLKFINNPFNLSSSILFFIVFPLFIITMLVNLSKISFLLLFIYLTLPILLLRKHIINILLAMITGLLLIFSYSIISERMAPMAEVISSYIFNNEISTVDTSTTARILESNTVFEELLSSPLSGLLGKGNGALLMDINIEKSGISPLNFRENGGLHHIHIEYVSILFRNGLMGLMFYLYWQFYIVKSSFKNITLLKQKDNFLIIFQLAIGIYFASYIIVSLTNNAMYGKLTIGLEAALAITLSKINKYYEK